MKQLQSKLIEAAGYSGEARLLTLHLTNGQRREYLDVPSHIYDELLTAKSAGDYYLKVIKPNFVLS